MVDAPGAGPRADALILRVLLWRTRVALVAWVALLVGSCLLTWVHAGPLGVLTGALVGVAHTHWRSLDRRLEQNEAVDDG